MKYGIVAASPITTGVATLDSTTRIMSIAYSANDKAVGPHNIVFTVLSPTSQALTVSSDFTGHTYALTMPVNVCEGALVTFTAGTALTDPQTYTIGQGAKEIQWNEFTYVTNPSGGSCAFTYSTTTATAALNNASPAAVSVNNAIGAAGRKLTINTSLVSLVSASKYTYTVAVKTPSGAAVGSPTQEIKLLISSNAACEPPTVVISAETQTITHDVTPNYSFTISPYAYTTSPANQVCELTYVITVPSAISAAVTCVDATRVCTAAKDAVTAAMVGAHAITMTAKTPLAVAITGTATTTLTIKDACDPPATLTAPSVAAQSFTADGTSQSYSPTWTATTGTAACSTGLQYTWTVPSALTSAVTVSTTSNTFTFSSSDATLAGTSYKIIVVVSSLSGAALTSPQNTAEFTLEVTAGTGTGTTAGAAALTATSTERATTQVILVTSAVSAVLTGVTGAATAAATA